MHGRFNPLVERSIKQRLGCLRWWVFVWAVLCQFPLPVLHAHSEIDSSHVTPSTVSLAEHLRRHHSGQTKTTSGLHWHWMLPGAIADCEEGDESNDRHHPHHVAGPFGLWSADGEACDRCEVEAESSDLLIASECFMPTPAFDHFREPALIDSAAYNPSGFLQTYSGVPHCALVCVSRQ